MRRTDEMKYDFSSPALKKRFGHSELAIIGKPSLQHVKDQPHNLASNLVMTFPASPPPPILADEAPTPSPDYQYSPLLSSSSLPSMPCGQMVSWAVRFMILICIHLP